MALIKYSFRPGVDRTGTRYTAEGTWYETDKVRFRFGYAEIIGGWQAASQATVRGVPRIAIGFASLAQVKYLGVGTNSQLAVWQGGSFYDITPVRASAVLTSAVSTQTNSRRVLVSAASHGITTNDYAAITTPATIGGNIFMASVYRASVVNVNSFAVDVSVSAAATSAGAGTSVTVNYLLATGASSGITGFGWGAGTWGFSTWNTARSTGGVAQGPIVWSLDAWGEDLLACPGNGSKFYIWRESGGIGARASVVAGAPSATNAFFITDERHVMALATNPDGTQQDQLLIRWCSQENYNDWTASATNTAGDYRLTEGTRIMGGGRSKGENVIFTDNALYTAQFQGPPFTFGFQQQGSGCGLIAQNAFQVVNGIAYWMSTSGFFRYNGRVERLFSTVQHYVFDAPSSDNVGINFAQAAKIISGINREFNEIWWFYPDASSSENNRYVIYNYLENTWAIGTLERTAWFDGAPFDRPFGMDSAGMLYYHETGNAADVSALSTTLLSGDFDLEDGDQIIFMSRIVPDYDLDGEMQLFINTRKYNNSPVITKGPFLVSADTPKVSMRARGRTCSLEIYTSATDTFYRIGSFRFDLQPDGYQ